jgi:hypothetical protein
MEVMDSQIKANSEEKKRVQSIADRRAELDREMDRKIEYARSQQEAEAQGFERADARAAEIRDERGAREFKGGMGMLSNLEEMGISPDTALRTAQDRLTGGREVGAPGSVRKELLGDFNKEVDRENLRQKDAARDARDEAREAERAASQARLFDQQDKMADKRTSAMLQGITARGGSRDDDKPETVSVLRGAMNDLDKDRPKLEDFRGNVKKHAAALADWNETDDGLEYKKLKDMIRLRTTGTGAPAAPAAPAVPVGTGSTNRDNGATKPAPISKLPPGSKQIGTSGGRPVFQTPDGKKFIQ